ncbi:MAG: LysM peptidoglycan-binding domain-containing protein [Acidobacteriota bacterium]|nr:LysM peptidoglycan-binding domain-containing protein [Acidobacteriota bacterium]MDE3191419.1 LysM peptidoglycan-binding domain-containing protein [Acidobacteriota bacterium]
MFVKLVIVATLAAFVVGLAARTTHGAGPERMYVVRPADTLWAIAARTYAGDPRQGVWELEQRNHLGSTTLTPGQRLILPG